MNALREECQQLRDELIALRREFHRAPELGLHEYHTAARIERELDRCGIPHERVGETAVVGHLTGNGNGSGLVVLRADIDALPIQETNDVPYRSQTPGMMHACGHDAHTTCLLGAAKVLSAHRADFGGEVRFLFQPAEEAATGAMQVLEQGLFRRVPMAGMLALHVWPGLAQGQLGIHVFRNVLVGLALIRQDGINRTECCARGLHHGAEVLGGKVSNADAALDQFGHQRQGRQHMAGRAYGYIRNVHEIHPFAALYARLHDAVSQLHRKSRDRRRPAGLFLYRRR